MATGTGVVGEPLNSSDGEQVHVTERQARPADPEGFDQRASRAETYAADHRRLALRGMPDAVGGAIAHALQEGWLAYREGAWLATPAGEEIGKRSRAGVKTKRKRL